MVPRTPNLKYRLADATIDRQDISDLIAWLQTDPWLTMGPVTEAFEERWANWLGVPYALFVNSGSSANLLMTYAAMLSGRLKNKKIIVPAVSWATTVAPAIQLGLEPILCEASAATWGLDPWHLRKLVEEHDPAAVIVVHVLGVPASMDPILDTWARHRFMLLEDTCAATGSRYRAHPVGTFSDMSTFSLFFGHHLSTIEGGMVCTADRDLYEILLQIRAHGWPKNLDHVTEACLATQYHVLHFNRPFTFYHPGFNVRSTDLNARIGLSQMDRHLGGLATRILNHEHYVERFKGSAFRIQSNAAADICSISFGALAGTKEHRDKVASALAAAGVETRPLGGGSMGRQPFWTDRYRVQSFPVADAIHERSFLLPNHPGLSEADIDAICDVVLGVEP